MKNSGTHAVAWLPAILAGGGAAILSSGDPMQRVANAIGTGLMAPLFVSFVVVFWTFVVSKMQGSAPSDAKIEFSNPIFLGALLACISLWLLNAVLTRGHMHDVARCVESALAAQKQSAVGRVVLDCDASISKKKAENVIIGL